MLGIILTTIGAIVKIYINRAYEWVVIGQGIAAVGQVFILITPATLAAEWFGSDERVYAVSIAIISQFVGLAVGYIMPSVWIKQDDSMKEFESNVHSLLIAQAMMSIFVLVLALFLLKQKPDFDILNAESSREVEAIPIYETFSTQFKKAIKNKNLIVLAIISGQA